MKLRLAQPSVLVDIGRVSDLSYIRDGGDHIAIGALTRHCDVETSDLLHEHVPLLAHAASHVGDPQVRHRGTIGGSIAHADPASDLPATTLALGATYVAQGPNGTREIAAGDFYQGFLTSSLAPDEMLTEIRIPKMQGAGWSFQKFNRRAQDWAIVGVAAWRRNGDSGVALVNMGSTPILATQRVVGARRRRLDRRCRRAGRRRGRTAGRPQRQRRVPPAPRQGARPPGADRSQQLSSSASCRVTIARTGPSAGSTADTSRRRRSLPAERRWWQRSPQEWWALLRTWPGLLSVSIAVTIVGAWLPWSFDGPVRLGGLEGSHDGWLAVLAACAAIATVAACDGASWPQMLIAFMCDVARRSTSSSATARRPTRSLGWGWFVALVGHARHGRRRDRLDRGQAARRAGVAMGPATVLVAASGGRRRAVALSVLVSLIFWQVMFVTEDDSWPPPADAITADGAQAAAEQFTSGSPRPRDLDLDYAWSTAATVEPFAEGAEFYPRIIDDIENADQSVHILMFGWDSNEIGTELADVLKQKLAEGVEVRIAVDDQGSNPDGKNKDMYSDLVRAGAEVVANDTIQLDFDGLFVDRRFDWRQDEFGRAEHRKLYVIDGDGGVDRRGRHPGPLRQRAVPRRDGARHRRRRAPGAGGVPHRLPRLRRPGAGRPRSVLPGAARRRHVADRDRAGGSGWLRVGDAGDAGVDRQRPPPGST